MKTIFVTPVWLGGGNDPRCLQRSTGKPKRAPFFKFLNPMVTIKKRKLVIELPHTSPKDFLQDLQLALNTAVRVLVADAARDVPALDPNDMCDAATPMLRLLQSLTYMDEDSE